jgi:PBP1b-binding outer membrane lipoprotein LpoB
MKKTFATLAIIGTLAIFFAGCASNDSAESAADQQQLDQPTTAPAAPHGNPLDVPDEATLPHVPGQ